MIIQIEIPEAFESHFQLDRFSDSLARVNADINPRLNSMLKNDPCILSGNYEVETIKMLKNALAKAEIVCSGGEVDPVADCD